MNNLAQSAKTQLRLMTRRKKELKNKKEEEDEILNE